MALWEIGNIDNSIIGATTPAAGNFTTLQAATDPVNDDGVGDQGFNDLRYAPLSGSSAAGILAEMTLPLNANTTYSIYTVPTSKLLIVEDVIIVAGGNCYDAQLTFGRSPAYTDWLWGSTGYWLCNNLNGANYVVFIGNRCVDSGIMYAPKRAFTAGEVFGVAVTGASASASTTNKLIMTGYIVDA